jgi:thiamine kinase-like enzyme
MTNNLKGHSGCILELTTNNNKNRVVKKSNKIEYNKRLEAQYKKQCNYSMGGVFRAVEVIKNGIDESGLFWFSMEYINGLTLADYMKTIPLADIDSIGKIFLRLVPDTILYDTNARSVFMAKIKALSKDIAERTEIIKISLQRLEDYRWEYMQYSPCHGDLTLENIIISNNTLYLIDFLDSFYDSWQIDIAKVLQDIEIFWHYRNEYIDNNLFIRLLTLKRNIVLKLLALKDGNKLTESVYHTLLLNILRIFPYTKDEHTCNFLQNQLVLLNRKIEKREWEREQ